MRLEYIAHSCFVIETGGKKIAFDPWIKGSAYHDQWHLYPKPPDTSSVENADIILISHGHEDHMHAASLKSINKNAHIFFPYQWRKGVVDYFRYLKFAEITEAVTFRTYHAGEIKITYLGYSLESVVVVECEGYVIVNINDALNSNHETASEFLLKKIKQKWPKIDFLLSGWSGAGYFPNKVHYRNKDDDEVARIREQYFADNFCKFTKYLQPEIAIPFAPGFVLLRDENRWINNVKFPRQMIEKYYAENFERNSALQFPITYPGDYFTGKQFHRISHYHQLNDDHAMYASLDEVFAEEISRVNKRHIFIETSLEPLCAKLEKWMNRNKALYRREVINDAVFSIRFTDTIDPVVFNIIPKDGVLTARINSMRNPDDRLVITTRASLLSLNLDKEWGGDLLSIGYGADVEVFEERSLEKNLDIVCMRLISRFPMFHEDFKSHAGRIIKYYLTNPSIANLWITQKIKLRPYVNKYPFNERDHWITYNKCDLCRVCKMPEVDFRKLNSGVA
jgi:hypothetical protein